MDYWISGLVDEWNDEGFDDSSCVPWAMDLNRQSPIADSQSGAAEEEEEAEEEADWSERMLLRKSSSGSGVNAVRKNVTEPGSEQA